MVEEILDPLDRDANVFGVVRDDMVNRKVEPVLVRGGEVAAAVRAAGAVAFDDRESVATAAGAVVLGRTSELDGAIRFSPRLGC